MKLLSGGKLRTGIVGICETDYEPPIPNKGKKIEELKVFIYIKCASATDKALEAFVWGTRGQFFWDGNKRTSLMLFKIRFWFLLVLSIMTITDKYMEQFNTILLNYYNTGKNEELKQFLYEMQYRA